MLKPVYLFLFICASFIFYSFSIYLNPPKSMGGLNQEELNAAAEGKLVWQKYNCQSCHQLYNLGGYLGPDLTNCIAQEGKGELYIKAMIASGTKQMPAFTLSETETTNLIAFLTALNKTGSSDLRTFTIKADGMIEGQEKHEH